MVIYAAAGNPTVVHIALVKGVSKVILLASGRIVARDTEKP